LVLLSVPAPAPQVGLVSVLSASANAIVYDHPDPRVDAKKDRHHDHAMRNAHSRHYMVGERCRRLDREGTKWLSIRLGSEMVLVYSHDCGFRGLSHAVGDACNLSPLSDLGDT